MKEKWRKLKTEINELVANTKKDLHKEFKSDYESGIVAVQVKYKDNSKDALITICNKNDLNIKSELQINLDNAIGLPKRFEKLLSEFIAKK